MIKFDTPPMNENLSQQSHIRVLHVGPSTTSKGGIAAVIGSYVQNKSLFESHDCDLSVKATCGEKGISGVFQFASAWLRVLHGAMFGKTDIVHLHTSIKGSLLRKWLLAATCAGLRQNFVVHIHNGAMASYVDGMPRATRIAAVWMLRHASHVVCLSREIHAWLLKHELCESRKCQIVHNGLAEHSFARTTLPPHSNALTILFLGRLGERKGVPVLLEAAEMLKNQGCLFRLLLGGDGDVGLYLADADRRGLSDSIEYLGWVSGEKKAHLLNTADIFVLPSRSEGFPVSVVEAMASGLAIVSTTIPGIVDAVTHKQEALLVPPGDANALAEALRTLISERALRLQLGAAAKQRFLDHFTIQRTVEKLCGIYRQVKDDSNQN
jgi:glycosyltransferase involved in cell wall biosynthesis